MNKDYHPDGFTQMNLPNIEEDFKAMERGIAFFEELRSNGHTGVVTSGASVKPNSPLGGVQKPLTAEQIEDLWTKSGTVLIPEKFEKIVRMIEVAHGIV